MPRPGVEELRRRQLVDATISTIGENGLGGTSLAEVARRAGLSVGLVSHYFDGKNGLLEATLRTILARLGAEARRRFERADTPRQRIRAIVDANLSYEQLDPELGAVWLAFWAEALHSDRLRRIQKVNQRRLYSNLLYAVRELVAPGEAERVAETVACLIDGVWLRSTLSGQPGTNRQSRAMVHEAVDAILDATIREGSKP